MGDIKLIVGLGNPGKEFDGTRHNVGFDLIDMFAAKYLTQIKQKKFNGLVGTTDLEEKKLIFLKPQTYMNLSGQAVATVKGFYKLDLKNIIVLTDDMALEPGTIRFRAKGSAGGHNGISDIIQKLGSNEFARLRIGIGKSPHPAWKNYVLGRPTGEQKELIEKSFMRSIEGIDCWLKDSIERTMTNYNGSVK